MNQLFLKFRIGFEKTNQGIVLWLIPECSGGAGTTRRPEVPGEGAVPGPESMKGL